MSRRVSRRPTWLVGLAASAVLSFGLVAALLTHANSAVGLPASLQVGSGVVKQHSISPTLTQVPPKSPSRVSPASPSSRAPVDQSVAESPTTTTLPPSRVVTVNAPQPVFDSGDANVNGNGNGNDQSALSGASSQDSASSPATAPTPAGDN